jgi:hypothetical protein
MHPRLLAATLAALITVRAATAAEGIWIEAEHLDGLQGYCWPLGKPEMKKTAGHWGLSGPGWAAEWNQGGESGFLSIAAGPDDDKASAFTTLEVPADGTYAVWVRYGDWREKPEPFHIRLEQAGAPPVTLDYGTAAAVEEDNEAKLYFGWAFAWARRDAALKKGPAKLTLFTAEKAPEARQIDVIALSTDPAYRPRIKERPHSHAWDVLAGFRGGVPANLEPLTRNRPATFELPATWKVRTFADKGFRYLWNVAAGKPWNWLTDDPNRVLYPYNVGDDDAREEFEKTYAGQKDVPIFADPRITPTFHGLGPGIFRTDPKTGEVEEAGRRFARWLDEHPDRMWGAMTNYHPGQPIGPKGQELFAKYRDRYVGAIAGEALGPYYADAKELAAATAGLTTRRQLADAMTPILLKTNAAAFRKVFGKDLDANPYADVISCLSVGNITYAPLLLDWGSKTVGYESACATHTVLPMRWSFIRGGARQWGAMSATYRSCNFGDSATIFTKQQSYTSPRNLFDNYYSVYSGAGMTWYKFDVWYQYMAGSSMYYHEQGFDEFWKPGGLTAAGVKPVQLSPKGQIVDRFLRLTAAEPDRGAPYTPVAFLVDYAHGWEPSPYWPNAFKNLHNHPDQFRSGDHERMLSEYYGTAYYPIGPESEKPISGTNEVNVPGVFGDVFDTIFAYPDVAKWRTIDTYPAVIVAGDITLTDAEGKRLAKYAEDGGTLLVADDQLGGRGAAWLAPEGTKPAVEAEGYRWLGGEVKPSQRYRYRPLTGGRALGTAPDGGVFCAAYDRGKGRLIHLSVPRGLGIDRRAVPVVPLLFAHLTRGLMPVEVEGDVEWLVNRTATGWAVTLLNPAGQVKPQQGITPTDYRQNRPVRIRARVPVTAARDRLLPDDKLAVKGGVVSCEVSAGGVRIVELR